MHTISKDGGGCADEYMGTCFCMCQVPHAFCNLVWCKQTWQSALAAAAHLLPLGVQLEPGNF